MPPHSIANSAKILLLPPYLLRSYFISYFKLGDPTPRQANDCSGTHFIVDNRLDLDKGCPGAAEGYSKRLPEIVHVKIQNLRKCAQLAFPLQLLFIAKTMRITKMM